MFAGKQMDNNHITLASYDGGQNSTIHVALPFRASGNDAWWQPSQGQQSSAHPPQQMPNHVVPNNWLPLQLNTLNARWQQLQQSKLLFGITLHFPSPNPNLMLLYVPLSPGNLNYCTSLMQSTMSMPGTFSNMLTEAN